MYPYHKTVSPLPFDDDAICLSQNVPGGGNFILNGSLARDGVATLDIPRHVNIRGAVDISDITYTVTGTNREGRPAVEEITGPAGAQLESGVQNFKTITQISPDISAGANVRVGINNSFELAPYIMDYYNPHWSWSVVGPSPGVCTWRPQFTIEDILTEGPPDGLSIGWVNGMTRTTDFSQVFEGPLIALRIQVSDFVSGSVGFHVLESTAVI